MLQVGYVLVMKNKEIKDQIEAALAVLEDAVSRCREEDMRTPDNTEPLDCESRFVLPYLRLPDAVMRTDCLLWHCFTFESARLIGDQFSFALLSATTGRCPDGRIHAIAESADLSSCFWS